MEIVTVEEIIGETARNPIAETRRLAHRIQAYGIDNPMLRKYETALREIASLRLNESLGPNSMALNAVNIAKTAIANEP